MVTVEVKQPTPNIYIFRQKETKPWRSFVAAAIFIGLSTLLWPLLGDAWQLLRTIELANVLRATTLFPLIVACLVIYYAAATVYSVVFGLGLGYTAYTFDLTSEQIKLFGRTTASLADVQSINIRPISFRGDTTRHLLTVSLRDGRKLYLGHTNDRKQLAQPAQAIADYIGITVGANRRA